MATFRVEGPKTSSDREQATEVEAKAEHGNGGGRGQALGWPDEREEEIEADCMDELTLAEQKEAQRRAEKMAKSANSLGSTPALGSGQTPGYWRESRNKL